MKTNKVILISYGCGGHREQAFRLVKHLFTQDESIRFYSVTDVGQKPSWSYEHLELGHIRDKNSGRIIGLLELVSAFYQVFSFIRRHKISNIISLGPGVSILVSIVAKILRSKIIHFESWSRFYSVSNTTKVMNYLADVILIQNVEMKKLIKKAKYLGRL